MTVLAGLLWQYCDTDAVAEKVGKATRGPVGGMPIDALVPRLSAALR